MKSKKIKKIITFGMFIVLGVLGYMIYRDMNPTPDYQYHLRNASDCIIANKALEVAKEVYPDLEPEKYHNQLDEMAKTIQTRIKGVRDPRIILDTMMDYLMREEGYCYDYADFFGKKASNRFLNGILDTKKGACFTLPLLFLCICERLNLPVYGVNAPQHFFLRWDDGYFRANIECTGGGGWSPDSKYIEDLKISEGELKNGCFMRNMTTEEVISDIYELRGAHYRSHGDNKKALRDWKKTVELNPKNVETWKNMWRIYREKGDRKSERKCYEKCKELGCNFDREANEADVEYVEHCIKLAKESGNDTTELEKILNKAIAMRNRGQETYTPIDDGYAVWYMRQQRRRRMHPNMQNPHLQLRPIPQPHHPKPPAPPRPVNPNPRPPRPQPHRLR